MAEQYDVSTYLLDHSHINDVMSRMALGFDGDRQLLIDRVYTPVIELDYDSRLGGKPESLSVQDWADRVADMHKNYEYTHHVVHNLCLDLPTPSTTSSLKRPDTATGSAYAHGFFYNNDSEGFPRKMARRNGGKYRLEFVRLSSDSDTTGNPWRLRKMHVRLDWQDLA